MIPKTIFQTSYHPPKGYVVSQIKKMSPGWNYIHFTDKEIIEFFKENYIFEFVDIIQKFNNMPTGAHKADLFRYYYLYVNGGVFIDSDAMLQTNIERVTKNHTFFSMNSGFVENSIFQGFIGAIPNHDIIYKALQNAYNIDAKELKKDYLLLVKNLYKIVKMNPINGLKLYEEVYTQEDHDMGIAKCYDDDTLILIHYFRDKIIPGEPKTSHLIFILFFLLILLILRTK